MSLIVIKPISVEKRLWWARADGLFFWDGFLFCRNGIVPFVLAVLTAEKMDSVITIDNLDEVIHRECLVAL